jgi:hypothetical protein
MMSRTEFPRRGLLAVAASLGAMLGLAGPVFSASLPAAPNGRLPCSSPGKLVGATSVSALTLAEGPSAGSTVPGYWACIKGHRGPPARPQGRRDPVRRHRCAANPGRSLRGLWQPDKRPAGVLRRRIVNGAGYRKGRARGSAVSVHADTGAHTGHHRRSRVLVGAGQGRRRTGISPGSLQASFADRCWP